MVAGHVQKRFELFGRDELDLERRLYALRLVIGARHGEVLGVQRNGPDARARHSASVRYQLPLAGPTIASTGSISVDGGLPRKR